MTVLRLDQALHGGSQHLLIQLHGNVVVLGDVLLGTLQLVIGFLWISWLTFRQIWISWLEGHNTSQHSSCLFIGFGFQTFQSTTPTFSSGCTNTARDPNDWNVPDLMPRGSLGTAASLHCQQWHCSTAAKPAVQDPAVGQGCVPNLGP